VTSNSLTGEVRGYRWSEFEWIGLEPYWLNPSKKWATLSPGSPTCPRTEENISLPFSSLSFWSLSHWSLSTREKPLIYVLVINNCISPTDVYCYSCFPWIYSSLYLPLHHPRSISNSFWTMSLGATNWEIAPPYTYPSQTLQESSQSVTHLYIKQPMTMQSKTH
jgi:hypothetical protein